MSDLRVLNTSESVPAMPAKKPSSNPNLPKLYTATELSELCERYADVPYLVEDLLGTSSIVCLVGRSGLGKSALLYQLCISVAGGVPFFGHKTHQGKAIYVDFENAIVQVKTMLESLSKFLGLDSIPDELLCCNANDPNASANLTGKSIMEIIKHERPSIVVIDSLSAAFPSAEEKNSEASETIKRLRDSAREAGTTVVFVHHLRKSGADYDFAPRLGQSELTAWFAQVRGASALINNSDVRIGFDEYGSNELLVMQGFARVTGELPLMLIERMYDNEGQPCGYRTASQIKTLSNTDRNLYDRLPNEFRFKDVMELACISNKPTNDIIKRMMRLGVITKHEKRYIKVFDESPKELAELRELNQESPLIG